MNRENVKKIFSLISFPVLILTLVIIVFIFREELFASVSSLERLESWLLEQKENTRGIFVFIQILQVVVFIIPGEIPQIAGGYLFGVLQGFVLSVIGIIIGSSINFFIGRALGKPFVTRLIGEARMEGFVGFLDSKRMRLTFLLLFLIPGFPKDILCYVAGLSHFSYIHFLLISMMGRIPGILGSSIIGSAAAERNWKVFFVLLALGAVLGYTGFLYRNKVRKFLERWK